MLLPASKQKVIGEKKTQTLSLDAEKFTLLKSTGICYNKKKIIFKQKKIKYIFCGFVVFVFFLTTVHVIIDIGDKDWWTSQPTLVMSQSILHSTRKGQ